MDRVTSAFEGLSDAFQGFVPDINSRAKKSSISFTTQSPSPTRDNRPKLRLQLLPDPGLANDT